MTHSHKSAVNGAKYGFLQYLCGQSLCQWHKHTVLPAASVPRQGSAVRIFLQYAGRLLFQSDAGCLTHRPHWHYACCTAIRWKQNPHLSVLLWLCQQAPPRRAASAPGNHHSICRICRQIPSGRSIGCCSTNRRSLAWAVSEFSRGSSYRQCHRESARFPFATEWILRWSRDQITAQDVGPGRFSAIRWLDCGFFRIMSPFA